MAILTDDKYAIIHKELKAKGINISIEHIRLIYKSELKYVLTKILNKEDGVIPLIGKFTYDKATYLALMKRRELMKEGEGFGESLKIANELRRTIRKEEVLIAKEGRKKRRELRLNLNN